MESIKNYYLKRTQKDYSISYKLAVVHEVESDTIGNQAAILKYIIQSHSKIT